MKAKQVGKFVWNVMALLGTVTFVVGIVGVIYGLSRLSTPDERPTPQPVTEATGAQFNIPAYYIEAKLAPLPPLASYTLPLATISTRTPIDRVLSYTSNGMSDDDITRATEYLSQTGYTCDARGSRFYTVAAEARKPAHVGHCQRELTPGEQRVSQARTGHVMLYLFAKEDRTVLVQLSIAGDGPRAVRKTQNIMDGFAW